MQKLKILATQSILLISWFGLAFPMPAWCMAQASGKRAAADRSAQIHFSELARRAAATASASRAPLLTMAPISQPPLVAVGEQAGFLPESAPAVQSLLGAFSSGFRPELRTNFLGLMDNHIAIVPDTYGAVGPEHLMVVLNSEVAIQNRQGQVLSQVTLADFWKSLGHPYTYDPRVVYDHWAKRWVVVTLADPGSTNSALLVGASRTSDPTGEWRLWEVDADPENKEWLDYPNVGFNQQWLVVSINTVGVVTNDFLRSSIFAFDKRALYSDGAAQYVRFGDPQFTVVPAVTFDTNMSPLFLLTEGATVQSGIANRLRLSKIQGAVGQETYVTNAALTPTVPEWSFSPGATNFAPQLGTATRIYANDSRLQSCVQRLGALWCVHHVFLPAGTNVNRSAVQWWQLGTNGAILQRGRLDDTNRVLHYAFPSLAVNRSNDVLIGYSRFSSNEYASAFYAYRQASDPTNTVRKDILLKAGLAPYHQVRDNNKNRWGDFSATVVDPLNDVDMWTLQEYAEMPDQTSDRWGTWWGFVGFQPQSPPVFALHPQSQAVLLLGTNVTLQVALNGTEPFQFQWWFNGTNFLATTNAGLVLTNFQPHNVGRYWVMASNMAGYATSLAADLTLVPLAVTNTPWSQIVPAGTNVLLSIMPTGTQPFYYQWRLNGTNLLEATNATLVITNFQIANEGDYSVLVSNAVEMVTRQIAQILVRRIPPPQLSNAQMVDNAFRMLISSEPRYKITIQTSTNLVDWQDYFSFTSSGLNLLTDPAASRVGQRFYRVFMSPP